MEFSDSLWKFGQDVLDNLSSEDGNVMFSPLSAFLALAVAMSGSRGPTFDEMSGILIGKNSGLSREAFFHWVKWLMPQLQGSQNVTVSIANRFYVDTEFDLSPSATALAKENFQCAIKSIDFKAKDSARKINKWVGAQTNGKINHLIDKIDPSELLLIINAVYFKGDWLMPFSRMSVFRDNFFAKSQTLEVEFMWHVGYYNYVELSDVGATVLEIKYKNVDYGLLIVLPNKKDSLEEVQKKIQKKTLEHILDLMGSSKVELVMPKFKIEAMNILNEPLQKMGCSTAFSDRADFSGLSTTKPLKISSIIQSTFIDVNEQGTEAAAATAIHLKVGSSRHSQPPKPFVVDHPFLFHLLFRVKDNIRVVIFSGKVEIPKQAP